MLLTLKIKALVKRLAKTNLDADYKMACKNNYQEKALIVSI
jgi:hypothetical protein